MNQYIVWGTQDCTRHPQGESDAGADRKTLVELEQHPAGRYVSGAGGELAFAGAQDHREDEGKAYSAAHFLV